MSAGRVYRAITGYLDESSWEYDEVGDDITVACRFKGSERTWRCIAQASEERGIALFYGLAVEAVPVDRRAEAAVLVTRANFGLLEGCFELDLDDGELRLRTSVALDRLEDEAFGPGGLARSLFAGAVLANVFAMDRYLPAILAVSEGRADALSAIAQVEGEGPAT